ncbi:MAG: TonB-dependent receptor [Gemmatimonadota bacterium]|nr:TonB-dependent receptor [Gemmatimonadota bacterium]
MLNRIVATLCAFGLCLVSGSVPVHGQGQATTGIVRGFVADSSAESVVGAMITLRNVNTNFERTTQTNARGVFVATLLPLGTYDVTVRSLGFRPERRPGIVVRLGETVDLPFTLARSAVEIAGVEITGDASIVDAGRSAAATRLSEEVVSGLPNNGRNFLNLTLLTPNVAIVQGPDGDELSVGGQRGIHNNVSVDGADFNNPFFGEQRGGQRPAFTFNLDAVQEMVVVSNGASAEFGRSGGGFVNIVTKSGTNDLHGTAHYYGKSDKISSDFARGGGNPNFAQHQFGFTLGGPIKRDRAFFFLAYDQQEFNQTKQTNPDRIDPRLRQYFDSAFGGALRGDAGPIRRTNDANALLAKLDYRFSSEHNLSLKYNYTNSKQINGTFDVDEWGRSANAVEKDYSHAVNGSLSSVLSPTISNEFRFQLSREDRPRPYEGPTIDGERPFPDTGADFANGYRFGMPFFIPIQAYDTRIQVLDNISKVMGTHLFKFGAEWNRTEEKQTFVGFAHGRYIFSSVDGFLNYAANPRYVECFDNANGSFVTSNVVGDCPQGSSIGGPLLFYLQFAPVPPFTSAEEAGTQRLTQHEIALYLQDTWQPRSDLTVNYGLRWEAQIQPEPLTPAGEVFFAPYIGTTRMGREFPSDGEIPSDWKMFQPRLGIAWDLDDDGTKVLRGSAGLYYARIPGLVVAGTRTSNGSIGQNIFRASFFNGFGLTPPSYPDLVPTANVFPDHPGVTVTHKDFRNPRTAAFSAGFEWQVSEGWAPSISYNYSRTDFLTRFVNRNDPVFGNGTVGPFRTGLPAQANASAGAADTLNGIDVLTVVESSAKSRFQGVTASLKGRVTQAIDFQANYTISWDKSDDDNERDPFSFRYARADQLDAEYGYSDRDQRHRVNLWLLAKAPWELHFNNRVSYYSAQPISEKCEDNRGSGERAASAAERICANGSILERNTLRKDNEYFSWDVRISRPFRVSNRGSVEAVLEVFNVLNTDNFRDPAAVAPLFNFDGTIRSGLGDPRQLQAGLRYVF